MGCQNPATRDALRFCCPQAISLQPCHDKKAAFCHATSRCIVHGIGNAMAIRCSLRILARVAPARRPRQPQAVIQGGGIGIGSSTHHLLGAPSITFRPGDMGGAFPCWHVRSSRKGDLGRFFKVVSTETGSSAHRFFGTIVGTSLTRGNGRDSTVLSRTILTTFDSDTHYLRK